MKPESAVLAIEPQASAVDRVDACVQLLGHNYPVFFRSDSPILTSSATAMVPTMLAICTHVEIDLRVIDSVSTKLHRSLATVQDIYARWCPRNYRPRVLPSTISPVPAPSENRVASFFTGGVDSFYTLLKHIDEITDIIFVHGLDIPLDAVDLRQKTSQMVREVGQAFGKNVIEIETDIRTLIDPYLDWREFGHGPALACIGHLLAGSICRVYIASSQNYSDLYPNASHLILDHLWSSEAVEFVHDGCEATRVMKVGYVAKCDTAMKHLRVCWQNLDDAYNCGRCEKCLRTMVALQAFGALERCSTFSQPLLPSNLGALESWNAMTLDFVRENLNQLEKSPGNEELKAVMKKVLRGPTFRQKLRSELRKHPHLRSIVKRVMFR